MASTPELNSPRGTAQTFVADYLRNEIRSGRMSGGTPIVAAPIATELGLSRMPVREAIQQLAYEGLITIRSNRSAVVTQFSPEEIDELYEMLAALEGYAMRLVTKNIDARGLQEAELALIRLGNARDDLSWFVSAHETFHETFLAYCPRPRMVEEVRRVRAATEPYLRLNLHKDSNASKNTVAEHKELLEAIASGDPDIAEQATRRHVGRFDIREVVT